VIVVLRPGESVEIQFFEADGEITVEYGEDAVRVRTEWPDSSGREGVIYEELFGDSELTEKPVRPIKT